MPQDFCRKALNWALMRIQLQTKDMRNQKAVKILEVTEESGEAGKEAGQPPVFSVAQDDRNLFVSTDKFSYTYDKLTGLFSELSYVNCKVLERPMEYNIWRAPTDNDRNIKNIWRNAEVRQDRDKGLPHGLYGSGRGSTDPHSSFRISSYHPENRILMPHGRSVPTEGLT